MDIKIPVEPTTIMPDGRTFEAWVNEIVMLRGDAQRVKERQKELDGCMAAIHIANIEVTKNPNDGDIIIRVRAIDQIKAYRPEDAILAGEVSREPSRKRLQDIDLRTTPVNFEPLPTSANCEHRWFGVHEPKRKKGTKYTEWCELCSTQRVRTAQ